MRWRAVLVEHLFRHAAGRMLAGLIRSFGTANFAEAEEAVQEALLRALDAWSYGPPPDNPEAWLLRTARNIMIDRLRRRARLGQVTRQLAELPPVGDDATGDERLALMFSCADPRLAPTSQIALILKALCGFGLREVAAALFATEAAIEKRVTRAKQVLKRGPRLFDLGDDRQRNRRQPIVLAALYLLFNEGYHSVGDDVPVRHELCDEALRLTLLLAIDPLTASPEVDSLLALMYFGSARLPGRSASGSYLPLAMQDRKLWDGQRITLGFRYLAASSRGSALSRYHLEAAIAAEHCRSPSPDEIDWRRIADLYDILLAQCPGPIVKLNRAIALGEARGPGAAIAALSAIADRSIETYPFFHATAAVYLERAGRRAEAQLSMRRAVKWARSGSERRYFEARLGALSGQTVASTWKSSMPSP